MDEAVNVVLGYSLGNPLQAPNMYVLEREVSTQSLMLRFHLARLGRTLLGSFGQLDYRQHPNAGRSLRLMPCCGGRIPTKSERLLVVTEPRSIR